MALLDASEVSCFLQVRTSFHLLEEHISNLETQLIMATMFTYSVTITTVKLSLLLFFRRIFNVPMFRTWSAIVGLLCVIWVWTAILTNLLQCSPITAAFKPELFATETCLAMQSWYWGITISNLVLDIIILVMPMWMVIDLRLPFAKKCFLCGLFGLGGM